MTFEKAWHLAEVGQILKHGDFSLVKGEFIAPDIMLVFYSGCPVDTGWSLSSTDVKVCGHIAQVAGIGIATR